MQYVVKDGLSIYDVAVLLYGDAQYSVRLCTENSITITDSIVGLTLTYDENVKGQQIVNNTAKTYVQVPINDNYVIKELQSNYDLCLQFGYGLDRYGEFLAKVNLGADVVNHVQSQIQVTKLNNNFGNIIFATLSDDVAPTGSNFFLLLEDGFYLLQENDDKIIL
jgi:hypothetical protein